MAIAFFFYLQAKHEREFNAQYDPTVLMGKTPAMVRGRLGEPHFVTESGAWFYNDGTREVLLRFEDDRVIQVRRNGQTVGESAR